MATLLKGDVQTTPGDRSASGRHSSAADHSSAVGGSPRVFLVHIMKTAGTTLNALLEQYYPLDRVPPITTGRLLSEYAQSHDLRRVDCPATEIFNNYDCHCAHTNFMAVMPSDFRMITVLRDPVARLRSLFKHWQHFTDDEINRSPAPPTVNDLKRRSRTMTLEQFLTLDETPIHRNFDNGMAKTLVENFPEARHNHLSDDELVREACRTIDSLACVGLTERFNDSLDLLCYRLGWPPVPVVQSLNVRASHKPAASLDSLPEIIRRHVWLDQSVYEYGRRLFERQHEAMVRDLLGLRESQAVPSDVTQAAIQAAIDERSKNALREHAAATNPPPSATITMIGALRGSGWHQREGMNAGRVYRWTGPGMRSTVDFVIGNARSFALELSVVSVMDEAMLDQLQVKVNGRAVQKLRVAGESPINRLLRWIGGEKARAMTAPRILRGVIPGETVGRDRIARIEITVPFTRAPSDADPSASDTRQKGIAIERCSLVGA